MIGRFDPQFPRFLLPPLFFLWIPHLVNALLLLPLIVLPHSDGHGQMNAVSKCRKHTADYHQNPYAFLNAGIAPFSRCSSVAFGLSQGGTGAGRVDTG